MLNLPTHHVSIYLCAAAVDLRKSFDGLGGLVQSAFDKNLLDGHLFLFVNKRRDRLKALWWDGDGLVLWYKRLERGTFEMPVCADDQTHRTLDATELAMLLGGVTLSSARRRQRLAIAS